MKPSRVRLVWLAAAILLAFAMIERGQGARLRRRTEAVVAAQTKDRLAAGRVAARHLKSEAWKIPAQREQWADNTLDSVAALKSALQVLPEQRIPELAFLTDEDWIVEAARLPAEPSANDLRDCLNELQNRAKEAFAQSAQKALNEYLRDSGGALPKRLDALAPFLSGRYDASLDSRYELNQSGSIDLGSPRAGAENLIVSKPPAQAADFGQVRIGLGRSGITEAGTERSGPKIQIPATLAPRDQRELAASYLAYMQSHDGDLPASAEALTP